MATPFLSEIKIFACNFPPKNWAFCNGQTLPINQNQALFALVGTTYGGNGQTTFALPNLRDRVPIHVGNGHTAGEAGGQSSHTVTINEMPTHTHQVNASKLDGNTTSPVNNLLADTPAQLYRANTTSPVALNAGTIAATGGSQAHNNLMPSLALNFCIALTGIFPSPT